MFAQRLAGHSAARITRAANADPRSGFSTTATASGTVATPMHSIRRIATGTIPATYRI
jgi:hypothetical protein